MSSLPYIFSQAGSFCDVELFDWKSPLFISSPKVGLETFKEGAVHGSGLQFSGDLPHVH